MTTMTFDSFTPARRSRSPVRRASASSGVKAATPLAATAFAAAPKGLATPRRPGTFLLVVAIAGLHLAGVAALSGARAPASHIAAQPIAIALVTPRVEPPPPPPPAQPRQQVRPTREKPVASTPRPAAPVVAASTPVVANDTPLAAASADTVQVATAPASPPAPPVAAVPEKITEPRGYAGYQNNPPPAYPPSAQKRGLEGQVVLKIHVLATGHPDNITVARSSGHAILDDAALKAVTQWTFEPARRGQTAIDGWVQVPLNFKI